MRRCRSCDGELAEDAIYCDLCGVRQENYKKPKRARSTTPWSVPGGLVTLLTLAAVGLALTRGGQELVMATFMPSNPQWVLMAVAFIGALVSATAALPAGQYLLVTLRKDDQSPAVSGYALAFLVGLYSTFLGLIQVLVNLGIDWTPRVFG